MVVTGVSVRYAGSPEFVHPRTLAIEESMIHRRKYNPFRSVAYLVARDADGRYFSFDRGFNGDSIAEEIEPTAIEFDNFLFSRTFSYLFGFPASRCNF